MKLEVYHIFYFFFFNDTATTEIYTLSLHDALPIWNASLRPTTRGSQTSTIAGARSMPTSGNQNRASGVAIVTSHKDRKSTRLNSSHANISYAVFCLKKKKK